MALYNEDHESERYLLVPGLAPLYGGWAAVSELLLRVTAGGLLAVHGWPKIQNPTGAAGMVESIGFYPAPFWSVMLAFSEFFGGILLAIGLLTRPAAVAGFVILCVTVYFHWVLQAEGFAGAEKSVIWAAICFYFIGRGGGPLSLDRKFGGEL